MSLRPFSLPLGLALVAGSVVSAVPTATGATLRPLPTKDPFYQYTGHTALKKITPGTVLNKRVVEVSLAGSSTPMPADQLLYRTTNERGQPAVTVTTVLNATTAPAAPGIVAYLSFYDALGPVCDPSYTLAGGDPGSVNQQLTTEEEAIISTYISQGYVVTIPDFEGENLDWAAGQESGFGTLDGIRATESDLALKPSTKVGLTGYSGGSIAAEWASELAPRYSPKVNLVGVAEGGIPVDFAHNLPYIDGSPSWSGVMPAVFTSLGRAFHLNVKPYLSAKGQRLGHFVRNKCIGSFSGAWPGLTVDSLLKPAYKQHFLEIPAFARIVNHLLMGTTRGHPTAPLFMAVGNSDGTGDGIMIAKDVEGLAHEYCQQHASVQLATYTGSDHGDAAVHFEPAASQFLQEAFAGAAPDGCNDVGKGNPLRPLPVHHAKHG